MHYDLFILFLTKTFRLSHPSLLYNDLVQFQLDSLSLDYLFFDGVLGDESVDEDFLFLADSVGAVHGLVVDLGVPVGVVEDDVVGGH